MNLLGSLGSVPLTVELGEAPDDEDDDVERLFFFLLLLPTTTPTVTAMTIIPATAMAMPRN